MKSLRTILVFVGLSFLGISTLWLLDVSFLPKVRGQAVNISFYLANSSPMLTELQVTSVLENAFSKLDGVKKIESVSGYDFGNVVLTLDDNTDIDFARLRVNAILRELYPSFPPGVSYPRVSLGTGTDGGQKPLLVFSINAPFSGSVIKETVKRIITTNLAAIEGVSELQLSGAVGRQLDIYWDPRKAGVYQQDAGTVRRAFLQQYTDATPGLTALRGQQIPVLVKQQAGSTEEFNHLKLPDGRGGLIPLSLFGKVIEEEQEPSRIFRINGFNSVNLTVYAHEPANTLLLADDIHAAVQHLKKSLPEGFEILTEYDDTEYLKNELEKITRRAVLSLTILTLFIFLVRREWRYLVVLLSGVLVTALLTFLIIFLFGIEVHLYSIAGLTLSFGLIIDNTLVMTDHLRRKGDRRVFLALLGASLTTIAALLMVFFLPEVEKYNLTDFSLAVCISLACSLLVALFYIPAAYEMLSMKANERKLSVKALRRSVAIFLLYEKVIQVLFRFRKLFIAGLILWFGLPVFWFPARWEGQEWYNRTVGNETYQEHVRPWVDRLLGGTLRMFVRNVFENSVYRTPEKTYLYVRASLPYGHTLQQMDQVIQRMEKYLRGVEGIDKFITQVVSGETAFITITFLPDYEHSSLPYQLKARLISEAIDLGGVKWLVYGVGQGFSNQSGAELPSFRVLLRGHNFNELESQARLLADRLLEHQRIQEVETDGRLDFFERTSQEYVFRVDPQQAYKYKIPVTAMISEVSGLSYPLGPSFNLPVSNNLTPFYIKAKGFESFSIFDFKERIFYKDERAFQMKNLGSLEFREMRNTIRKEDRQYLRMVSFDYFGSYKFGSDYLDRVLEQMKVSFPPGYTAERMDPRWSWEKVQRQYGLLLVLLAIIYWICAILFENFRQPFYILLTIPVSFIGLLGAFVWFDLYFDQGGYAAFILLGGLVVNSSIFIINDYNNQKKCSPNRRIAKAATGKLFPIAMTVLSTCLGLIPFLIDGQNEVFWFSLAAGTVGGLLVSFIAVFLLVPVLMMKKHA